MATLPPTLTQRTIALYQAGDVKGALRAAKEFRLGLTKAERTLLARAYECLVRPDFYRSIGYDPEAVIAQGRGVFETRIMREEAHDGTRNA